MINHDTHPSRRTVLAAGLTGAAGLIAGPAVWAAHSRPASAATPHPTAATPRPTLAHPESAPEAAATPLPGPAPRPPAWQRRWSTPIRSLADFERRSRSPRFPRSAIMLTIDDGPSPVWTPRYLRLLAKHDVTATFCMIGRQVHPNRHLAHDVAARGHRVANHTWTHDEQLETRSAADIRSEIERTSAAIHAATGTAPTQFRAPGGCWGPRILAELARQKMMPLGWDIDPRDWALPGTAAIEQAMLATRRHDIILCHDGGGDRSQTYGALERVIPTLLDRGYEFVTLP